MSFDYLFKVILIGDRGVGKSQLLLRFANNSFDEEHRQTIGVEFSAKTVNINDVAVKLQVWDTSGDEKYRAITRSYYRAAAAEIFVYDLSKRDSFDSLNNWINDAAQSSPSSAVRILVGNKADKEGERAVFFEEAQNFANRHHLMYLETSAKTGINVDNVFNCVAGEVLMGIRNGTIDPTNDKLGIFASKKE